MNCLDAEVFVTALYDNQPVPTDAAEHVTACPKCRRLLRDYSEMGAELRLAAAAIPRELPALALPARRPISSLLWSRVSMPRLAFASLLLALALSATISVLPAQPRPQWLQFGVVTQADAQPFSYTVTRAPFDDVVSGVASVHGAPFAYTLRIRVEEVRPDAAILRCRAIPGRIETTSDGAIRISPEPAAMRLKLDDAPLLHFRSGETLAIPVDGGGTVYLKGAISDHRPSLAFGTPLEPASSEMALRWPVLVDDARVIAQFEGAVILANSNTEAFHIDVPGSRYWFSPKPVDGAVQGTATWGNVTFTLDGRPHRLTAAAPIFTGDARPIWVRRDSITTAESAVGARPIPVH